MNKLIVFVFLALNFSCKKVNNSKDDTIVETETIESPSIKTIDEKKELIVYKDTSNWQKDFGLTHDVNKDTIWYKPVRFYIENPNCDKTAIDFYYGKYEPTDSKETSRLLQLVITDDSNLRPFYRWILNKTIQIQDGALAEYTGVPARNYAEKFPTEFFEYMDFDPSGEKYLDWSNSILYSGFYREDDFKKPQIIRQNMIKTMKSYSKNCTQKMNKKIEKFALDCFPDQGNKSF